MNAYIAHLMERIQPDEIAAGLEAILVSLPALTRIADQLTRLNANLEAGTLSIRTHHPLCATPQGTDYSIQQLDVMSKFLNTAIAEGRLQLPPREVLR